MVTRTSFNVKFLEIDSMKIVYHVNYPRWFEIGRMDYLKKAGISNQSIVRQGFYLPLSEIECKYKSPAKLGDEITVWTEIVSISCVKLKFEYKITNKKTGKLLAVGHTVHAWTDKQIQPVNIEKAAPEIISSLRSFAEKPSFLDEKTATSIFKPLEDFKHLI